MLDDFKMGPNLVRGFAPAGIGPRDITPGTANDAIGGTNYWGASLEFQYPFYFLPKDSGFRGAVFVDAGSVWGYKGETHRWRRPVRSTVHEPRNRPEGSMSFASAACNMPTPFVRCRSAPASSGIRRSARCGSILPIR